MTTATLLVASEQPRDRTSWRAESSPAGASQRRILLVSHDNALRASLREPLEDHGYLVEVARDADAGKSVAGRRAYDLFMVDGALPERKAFDLCRELRGRGDETPVLLFTELDRMDDRIEGLRLGADDCLTKPFELTELLARIEARLRRHSGVALTSGSTYRAGEISVDFRKAELRRQGVPVDLSPKEYQLLRYLIEHRGATISRDELLNEVWGYDAMPSTRTVDVHVAWLRRKLEVNPRCPQLIITVHGMGYKFADRPTFASGPSGTGSDRRTKPPSEGVGTDRRAGGSIDRRVNVLGDRRASGGLDRRKGPTT